MSYLENRPQIQLELDDILNVDSNRSIPDLEWFYEQIIQDRFELLEKDTVVYDKLRDKISIPGKQVRENETKECIKHYLKLRLKGLIEIPNVRQIDFHRFVWMYYHRQLIPEGYQIHHKDEDKWNNWHENLELITLKEHVGHHYNKNNGVNLHSEVSKNESLVGNLEFNKLRKKYFYMGNMKLCSCCNRFLTLDKFTKDGGTHAAINFRPECKECRSVRRSKTSKEIYQFPLGMLNDYIITDIRFKFNIMNWTFNAILKKYISEGLTEETLKDILLGKTYTHLKLVHGKSNTTYRNPEYVTEIEYNHIRTAKAQADFTIDELCMIYGRDKEIIETILKHRNYENTFGQHIICE